MTNLGLGPSKIMIHKATEVSREASNLLKSAEQAQASAQKAVNAQADALQRTVQDVNKAEAAAISRDDPKKRDGGRSEREREAEEANREAEEAIIAQADVGTQQRLLDIRI
jgi:methionine synthase II (cobalamin-independent)